MFSTVVDNNAVFIFLMRARLAARGINEQELTKLEGTHQASCQKKDAGDEDGYFTQNSVFHHCIYRAAYKEEP